MKKLRKFLIVLLCFGSIIFLQACEGTPSNVYTFELDNSYTEYITLGTSADYPPYEWPMEVNGKNTVVGIDIELAKKIANKLKKNLKVVNKGFDFLITDLEDGRVDFVISGMNPTDERKEKVDFSIVYYEASHVVMVHKENANLYDSISSINKNNIKVAAQLGSVQQDLANEYMPDAFKQFLQNVPDLIMQLNDKSVDAVIVEKPVAESYLKRFKDLVMKDFEIGDPEDGSAVAVRKGSNELLTTINSVIADLIVSGEMTEMIANAMLLEEVKTSGFSFLFNSNYIGILLKGLLMTFVLALLSVVFGSVIALGIASMRLVNHKIVNGIARVYVDIIRGTPLLIQVLLIYSVIRIPVINFIGIDISTFLPGMLALLINSSAYVSEIIRGGVLSVDDGQKEAGLSLGMTNKSTMTKVILPQAIKNIIPSLGNEFVTMIKETSIFMYLGVAELMYSAQVVKTSTYAIKEVYITVALLYLVLTLSTSKLMGVIEKRLRKNE